MGLQLNATSWLRIIAWSVACLVLPGSVECAAQVGEHLNDQVAPRTDYLPAKPADPFQLPPVELPARPNSPEENAVKLKLDRVVFRGNIVISQKELDAIATPYVGHLISLPELEDLRLHLTKLYIDRGYVTSGVLLSKGIRQRCDRVSSHRGES